MGFKMSSRGNFENTERFCKGIKQKKYLNALEPYAKQCVEALRQATPKDTGETAMSWWYEISSDKGNYKITLHNDKVTKTNIPIVILLTVGHATGNGGYVQGIEFIEPTLKPIFDKIADTAWKNVQDL